MIIKNINNLKSIVKKLKSKNKRIGLCHGVFDLLHSGHILHLKEAKKNCDVLIVSITADKFVNKGPNRPYLSQDLRIKIIQSLKEVDYVFCNNDYTPINIIKIARPNFYIKGKDYSNTKSDLTNNLKSEIKTAKKYGGKFLTTQSLMFSSTKIINEKFNSLGQDFLDLKKKINKLKILKQLEFFLKNKIRKKILIIGEPIIDEYTYVNILGKSAKNNMIATNFINNNVYGGGTILVANLLSEFIHNVDIVSFKNRYNLKFYKKLLNKNIKNIFLDCKNSIIKKRRFIDKYSNQKLYQINYNNNFELDHKLQKKFLQKIKKIYNNYDKIIILDYGHNLFEKNFIKFINKIEKKVIVNCQSNSSNFGFNLINKYKKCSIVCMDEIEFRLSVNDKYSPIKILIKKNKAIISKYQKFIITMGKSGSYTVEKNKIYFAPSVIKTPIDTTGSGDVFYAINIICFLANKLNNYETSLISHIGAGLHSSEMGNNNIINPQSIFRTTKYIID